MSANGTTTRHYASRGARRRIPVEPHDALTELDATALIRGLAELVTATIRQAQLDALHVCSTACINYDRYRLRRECRRDAQSAKHFLAHLRNGLLPDWMADVVHAARVRVAASPGEPYQPRYEHAPRHDAVSMRYQHAPES